MEEEKKETGNKGDTQNDDKWGAAGPDDSVPPEIARLTDFTGYYTFANDDQGLNNSSYEDIVAEIIGPGPEEVVSLDFIKQSILSLKPFVQTRIQESRHVVQVLEIYPTGETGYKTAMTLAKLLQFVRKLVEKIGDGSNSSSSNGQNHSSRNTSQPSSGNDDIEEENKEGIIPDKSPVPSEISESVMQGQRSRTPDQQQQSSRGGDSHKNVSEIQYHDLRYLENQFHTHEEPTVLVRKHAVLISLNPLRAIITADRMMLIVPDGADSLLYMLHDYMHGIVEDADGSFDPAADTGPEIRAYKALFSTITAIHQQEYLSVCAKVERALSKFQSMKTITVELQEAIRVLKNTVSSQGIKVAAYQRLIRDLLGNDEDLALMNLSLLKENQILYSKPLVPEIMNCKDDVSDMLESYLLDYNTLGTKLEFLKAQIQNTDELVSFRLDTFRNDLLIADVTLAIVMISLTVGTYVTNIFGMNLDNGMGDQDSLLFWMINVALIIIMFLIFWFLSSRYKLTGTVPVVIDNSKNQGQANSWW